MGFEWDKLNRSHGTRLEKTNTILTPLIKLMALSPKEVLSNMGNTGRLMPVGVLGCVFTRQKAVPGQGHACVLYSSGDGAQGCQLESKTKVCQLNFNFR